MVKIGKNGQFFPSFLQGKQNEHSHKLRQNLIRTRRGVWRLSQLVVVHFGTRVLTVAETAAVTAAAAAEVGGKPVHFDRWGVLLLVGQKFPEVGTELSGRKRRTSGKI